MTKRIRSVLQYIIFLGLGIFLVWWQLRDMTKEEAASFRDSFTNANYWLIIPIVIMALLSHLSRAARWRILMQPMGYRPALKNAFACTMVGYLANSAVNRLGEILKCTFLSRYENIPADKLIGTILVERVFDLICYVIFIAITILIQVDVVGKYVKDKFAKMADTQGLPIWGSLLIIIAAIILLLYFLRWLIKKYPEKPLMKKIRSFGKGTKEGLLSFKHLKNKGWFLAHTVFIWAMYLLQIYVGFSAIEQTSHLGLNAACSVLTLATLAMIITPSGIGLFPVAITEVLRLYHIHNKSFGWLMWGVSTSILVVVGFICLMLLPYMNRKKQHPHVVLTETEPVTLNTDLK